MEVLSDEQNLAPGQWMEDIKEKDNLYKVLQEQMGVTNSGM